MAVINDYANSDRNSDKKAPASSGQGADSLCAVGTYEVESGDSNGSIIMFFTDVPKNAIIQKLELSHDAFGASGSADIGVYSRGTFTAKDDDVFGAAIDISSAGKNVDGMEQLDIADYAKKLYEHAGDSLTGSAGSYDIGVILDNVGATGAGTLTLRMWYSEGI